MADDAWTDSTNARGARTCGRCGMTYDPPIGVGWVATSRPRPAWVCPACTRETGMEPGDVMPELLRED